MNIQTIDLYLWFDGYDRAYYNISRTAVKYFLAWHQENPDFLGYDTYDHVSLTSH